MGGGWRGRQDSVSVLCRAPPSHDRVSVRSQCITKDMARRSGYCLVIGALQIVTIMCQGTHT
ncbi:hypothetical protein J6590_007232 [Homalodisca vitripennis]|nr:hypothetical protein J6590_007232 [Homalodisca vitripennis]